MTKEELKPIDTSKYKITETGQVLKMTKDEMKNRISMALKDPVLQQGFEIICKENVELKEKISVLLSCKNCSENKGGWICVKEYENKCLSQKIEFIKELQKEKAELKRQLFSLRNERNTFLAQNEQCKKDLINFNENLTKAKEILRKFLDAKSIEETCVAESEAEQFLINLERYENGK